MADKTETEYVAVVEKMSDAEIREAVAHNVYNAAVKSSFRHDSSEEDAKCGVLYRHCKGRSKEELYQQGYDEGTAGFRTEENLKSRE